MSAPVRVTPYLLRSLPLPELPAESDKNDRGRVLIVGGGAQVPGAALLAAHGALRAGAGKVQIATPRPYATELGLAMPEARVLPVAATASGEISPDADLENPAASVDAVVIGPGMLDEAQAARLTARLGAAGGSAAFLVDAAALTGLSAADKVGPLAGRLVLTPHAGEMARLLGVEMETVRAEPLAAARTAAARFGAVVVMKGVATHIVTPDGAGWLHDGGCRGLGASGSGDVLAGVIGGLLARGAAPATAALWGVWLHGAAGEALARRVGRLGFLARELPREIPTLLDVVEQGGGRGAAMSPQSKLTFGPIIAVAAGLAAACEGPAPPVEPRAAPHTPVVAPPPPAQPPAAAPAAPEATPALTPPASPTPPAVDARWQVSRTADGAAATLSGPRGVLLRIVCVGAQRGLRVDAPTLRRVASEDRLSIGLGNDPIALAANLQAPGDGVTARGALPPNIAARILRSRQIGVNYGSQNLGPFDPPRGQDAMALANGCAEAASPRQPDRPAPETPDEEAPQRIPASFRGEWNTRLQDCGTGRNDSRLMIEAREVRFYESRGEVTAVTRQGPRAITVDARYRGEGEAWNRSVTMTLSRAGDRLTIDGMTRQRCPSGARGQ